MELTLLAAGLGTRMGDLVNDRPKTLVEVESGRSILELNLRNYAAAIERPRVTVVGGHYWEKLQQFVEKSRHFVDVRAVFNAEYAASGPLRSVAVGLGVLSKTADWVAIANGDTIFTPKAFRAALTFSGPGFALLTSEESNPEADDMIVSLGPNGSVVAARKQPDRRCPALISAGFLIVRGHKAVESVRRALHNALDEEKALCGQLAWHSLIAQLAAAGEMTSPILIPRSSWREFDKVACVKNFLHQKLAAAELMSDAI